MLNNQEKRSEQQLSILLDRGDRPNNTLVHFDPFLHQMNVRRVAEARPPPRYTRTPEGISYSNELDLVLSGRITHR